MTKADRIGHLCVMSRHNIDHTRACHLNEDYGYTYQLEQIAKDGGFITEGTEEAIGLENSAKDLLRLAKEILNVRNQLLANNKPVLQIVS